MNEWIPLAQTALWVVALLAVVAILREDIRVLRLAIRQRLADGAPLKLGAWLELGEVRQEVRGIRQQVDDIYEKVAVLFLSTMSPTMYLNLRKLEQGQFGPFEANDGLKRELSYLRDLGYVEVQGIRQLPSHGSRLDDYVQVTPTGRDFVRLRESLTTTQTGPSSPPPEALG
jgi:hypothetical protein